MPPKRKAKEIQNELPSVEPRRSRRRTSEVKPEAAAEKPDPVTKVKLPKKSKKPANTVAVDTKGEGEKDAIEEAKPAKKSNAVVTTESADAPPGRQYWLMKAEPESRMERGHDVRFSIDDLAAKTEPEPWDGIRAYPARNNLRAMKKGDLAFFYHSNTKVPAIVGTMEIVEEHSPDLSAHDPKTAYYDPKSKPEDPKWSVVHVTFKQKIKTPITLKELKAWQSTKGHPLENMQMLKLARLSVSKVSEAEWRFLVGEMEKNGDVIEQ